MRPFQGLSHWLVDGHHLSAFHGLLRVSVPFISSYKDTNHIGLGFTLVASFYLITSSNILSPNTVKHSEILSLGLKHVNSRGMQFLYDTGDFF